MAKSQGTVYHSGYYRLSKLLKSVRFAVLGVLAVFTLVIFLFFGQDMTLSHFRYFLNNFDFSENATDTAGDVFYYDADADASFGFVSGGFVTLTDTRVFVTDRSSSTTFSAYHGYRMPMGVYSDRYMVIYDRAGSSATVYNAFSALKSLEYEGTLTDAAVSDSGSFAIAAADVSGYYTKIYIYDSEFTLVRTVSKYKYLVDMAFDEAGDMLYTLSRYTEDGKVLYELQGIDYEKGKASFTETLTDAVYKLSLEEEDVLLLCDGAILRYREGALVSREEFSFPVYKSGAVGGGVYLVSSGADSRKEQFYFYGEEGRLEYPLPSSLLDCKADGEYLYLFCENNFFVIDKKTKECYDVGTLRENDGVLTLVQGKNAVYFAGVFRADRLDGKALIENIGK